MPNYIEPLGQLGYTYFVEGKYSEARPFLEAVLTRSPGDAWNAYYLSQILKAENDSAMALARLEQAIAASPNPPWDWAALLGDWRLEQGNEKGALEAYELALRWKPVDPEEIQLKIERLRDGQH